MTEHYLLVLSGLGLLAMGCAVATLLAWRGAPATPRPSVEPYVGEFVPAETKNQRLDREKLSTWLAMIHNPDM